MTNKERYDQIFTDCFSIEHDMLNDKFVYQSVPAWDSVGHMGMIASIEDTFNIMMDTDDIINFSSYTIGFDILSKYNIEF